MSAQAPSHPLSTTLLSLPEDILVTLPSYLHNIEDFISLSSTCHTLHSSCTSSTPPQTILHLAAASSTTFFRPSPHYLVCAIARELGTWARGSDVHEAEFALACRDGLDGLLQLALSRHVDCGLTMEKVRRMWELRGEVVNYVADVIDKCVGVQWYAQEDFWDTQSDAYTIDAEAGETIFHLAIYGELFAEDFEPFLNPDATSVRRLKVETRLEFIKYCLPDFATEYGVGDDKDVDPRRRLENVGPYAPDGRFHGNNNNIALTWVIRSKHWKPHWKAVRQRVGPDFQEDFDDGWWYEPGSVEADWRQRFWENIMCCQGLEALGMIRPGVQQDAWLGKVKEWREKIERLEREPDEVCVDRQATLEYPYLLGDLRICASGYVVGT